MSKRGIALTSIRNKSNGVEHLSQPSALFELSAEGFIIRSNVGVVVDSFSSPGGNSELTVRGHFADLPLDIQLHIETPDGEPAVRIGIQLTNTSSKTLAVHGMLPSINGIVTPGPAS